MSVRLGEPSWPLHGGATESAFSEGRHPALEKGTGMPAGAHPRSALTLGSGVLTCEMAVVLGDRVRTEQTGWLRGPALAQPCPAVCVPAHQRSLLPPFSSGAVESAPDTAAAGPAA